MFPKAKTWTKKFLQNEEGVTAIEYCVAAAFIGATIIGSLSVIGPEINRYLGNAFLPNAGVVQSADCGKGLGNCGVGLGKGGGNGTSNEGKGKGPDAEKEKSFKPGKGAGV